MERLNAYREAGADCLFVPGVSDRDTIARLTKCVNGPLNILATAGSPSISEMSQLGSVRQIARELRDHGTFPGLADQAIPFAEVQTLLSRA